MNPQKLKASRGLSLRPSFMKWGTRLDFAILIVMFSTCLKAGRWKSLGKSCPLSESNEVWIYLDNFDQQHFGICSKNVFFHINVLRPKSNGISWIFWNIWYIDIKIFANLGKTQCKMNFSLSFAAFCLVWIKVVDNHQRINCFISLPADLPAGTLRKPLCQELSTEADKHVKQRF